ENAVAINVHRLLWDTHQDHNRTLRRELRLPPILTGFQWPGWFARRSALGVERGPVHRVGGGEQRDSKCNGGQDFHEAIKNGNGGLKQKAPVSEIRPSSNAISGSGSLSRPSRRAGFVEFEKSFNPDRRHYYRPVAGAIIGPWPYLRVIRRSSLILKVEQTSFEKPYAACFDFIDSADQLHAALGLAFPAFRRFENLAHTPADIGLDAPRAHHLGSESRVEIEEGGQDAINEKLNPRVLPRAVQECVDRCGDRAAMRVSEYDEEWCTQMVASVLQASRDFR